MDADWRSEFPMDFGYSMGRFELDRSEWAALLMKSNGDAKLGWLTAAILLIPIVVLGRMCTFEFVSWDDGATVYGNKLLNPPSWTSLGWIWTHSIGALYIPFTYTVWAGVAAVSRVQPDAAGIALNSWYFHATNLLFHLVSVWLVFCILRQLNSTSLAAAAGAVLFAIHPIQVEAVGWVSGLKDVLSGTLSLAAIRCYLRFAMDDGSKNPSLTLPARSVQYRGRWLIVSCIAFVLAMLAKPGVMAIPLATAAIDRWAIGRRWRAVLAASGALLLVGLPLAIVAKVIQPAPSTPLAPLALRPLIATDSLAFYMYKLAVPLNLCIDYGRSTPYVIHRGWCYWDWIFPSALATLLVLGRRRRPALLVAGIVFLAGCLPTLGFTRLLFQYYSTTADHYLYLSMLGPAIALAWVLTELGSKPAIAVVIIWLAALGILAFLQTAAWRDTESLNRWCARANPATCVGWWNLGAMYEATNQPQQAGEALHMASEQFARAIEYRPDDWLLHSLRGDSLDAEGRIDEAIQEKVTTLGLINGSYGPQGMPEDHEKLGRMLAERGRFAEAIPQLQAALKGWPDNAAYTAALKQAMRDSANTAATQASH